MTVSLDPMIGKLQDVLDLRLQQHALTASNLANADTPGYKAKVVDFGHVLDQAMGEDSALTLARTDPRHLAAMGASAEQPPVLELEPAPWSVDGNSVLPEREVARMQSNALMYNALAQGLDHKLTLLRFVVSDGRV
jgi:flagellar basal-body rod protein FlgB